MDEQLKKRLVGAAVVLLLGFVLVSLLPQQQETPLSETPVVTIPLQVEVVAGEPEAPPAAEATPSTLQAAAGNDSTLNPAELAAASGGDDDAAPDASGSTPSAKPSAASAPGALSSPAPPATAAAAPTATTPPTSPPPARPVTPAPAKPVSSPAAGTPAAAKAASSAPGENPKPAGKEIAKAGSVPVKPVTPPVAAAPTPAATPAPAPQVVPAKPQPINPATVAPPRGGNWFVQIGGYADIDNARLTQKQVQSHKQDCIIAPVDTNKGTIYRVRAGPYASREAAQAAQAKLATAGFASAALVAP